MVPRHHLKSLRDLLPLPIWSEETRRCAFEKHHLTETLTRHDQMVSAQTLLEQNCKELPPRTARNNSHNNPGQQRNQTRQTLEDTKARGDEQPSIMPLAGEPTK